MDLLQTLRRDFLGRSLQSKSLNLNLLKLELAETDLFLIRNC